MNPNFEPDDLDSKIVAGDRQSKILLVFVAVVVITGIATTIWLIIT